MTKSRVGQTMGLNQVQDGKMFLLIGFAPDCGVGKEDFEMVEI